jgi:hypothetical protein
MIGITDILIGLVLGFGVLDVYTFGCLVGILMERERARLNKNQE